jgi:hypothetical protein
MEIKWRPRMTQTWWLSFSDPDRPTGQQFLGAVVIDVDAADVAQAEPTATALRAAHGLPPLTDPADRYLAGAIGKTHRLGCNPGGEVASMRIDDVPDFATHGSRYPRGQVLSRVDIDAIDAAIAAATSSASSPSGPASSAR